MTGTSSDPCKHGPTRREQQLLDLRDAGLSVDAIVAEMGLSRSTVTGLISRYYSDDRSVREAAIRHSTRRLGDAIAAYRSTRQSVSAGR